MNEFLISEIFTITGGGGIKRLYIDYRNSDINKIQYMIKTYNLDQDPSNDTNTPTQKTVRPINVTTYIQNLGGVDTGLKIMNPYDNARNPTILVSREIKFDKSFIKFNYITKFNLNKNIDIRHNNIIISPRYYFVLYYPDNALIDFYDHKNVRMKSVCVLTDNESEINRVENQIINDGIDSVDDRYKLNKCRNLYIKKVKHLIPQEGDDKSMYYSPNYKSGGRYSDYIDYTYQYYEIRPIPKKFFNNNNNNDYIASKYGDILVIDGRPFFDIPIDASRITNVMIAANIYIPITNNNYSDKYYRTNKYSYDTGHWNMIYCYISPNMYMP